MLGMYRSHRFALTALLHDEAIFEHHGYWAAEDVVAVLAMPVTFEHVVEALLHLRT
jgi:hypothetical protein